QRVRADHLRRGQRLHTGQPGPLPVVADSRRPDGGGAQRALRPAAAVHPAAAVGDLRPAGRAGDRDRRPRRDRHRAVRLGVDRDLDGHGFRVALPGVVGTIGLPASAFPHGVGTYGVALRGTRGGKEMADSTSFWSPLRYASPRGEQLAQTPKIQAAASLLNGSAPLFYEAADTGPDGGSTQFAVSFDVRSIRGARGALIEFSAPTLNFA